MTYILREDNRNSLVEKDFEVLQQMCELQNHDLIRHINDAFPAREKAYNSTLRTIKRKLIRQYLKEESHETKDGVVLDSSRNTDFIFQSILNKHAMQESQ